MNLTLKRRKLYKILGITLFMIAYRYVGDWAAKIFYDVEFVWSFSPHHYVEGVITVLLILETNKWANDWVNARFLWAKKIFLLVIFHGSVALVVSFAYTPIITFISGLIRNDLGFDRLEMTFAMLTNWGMTLIVLTYSLVILILKQWRESIVEVERFKKENIEFRFETLKNQVNPHFLFNSLNTLSSLMHVDIEAAEKFLRQLSKVYRYVLENRDKELISLRTELRLLNSYIYLVEMRFKDKLHVKVNLKERFNDYGIPPMTLQLLIENAIKHNEISKEHPLTISVSMDEHDYLTVANTLQLKSSREFSTKVGLSNIINRYKYLSDKKIRVQNTNGAFIVKIPLLKPES